MFSSNDKSYSRVCGRVIGYQKVSPDTFHPSHLHGLEGSYVDGVSITHGAVGSRQHIWSFAAALYESQYTADNRCPCNNEAPSFIENNYFCDSGNPDSSMFADIVYSDHPLWDSVGCGPTSSCCQRNTPPWFCTALPRPTTDDIELRICNDESPDNEDTLVSFVDLNIM